MAEIYIINTSYWEALEKTAKSQPMRGVLLSQQPTHYKIAHRDESRKRNQVLKQQSSSWQLVVIAIFVLIISLVITVVFIWGKWKGIQTRNKEKQKLDNIEVEDIEDKPKLTLRGDEDVK